MNTTKNVEKFIPIAEPDLDECELINITDCVHSGWISSLGEYVTRFENSFSRYCGATHGVSCSNGTAALHLSLLALNVKAGDEVICPALTFIATANAIHYTGAKPVFIDSEIFTWNMDPAEVEKAITIRTKAIIVVHLYGHPANIAPILEIAKKNGIHVIEDVAQAHGAMFMETRCGSMGVLGCFSFYGNKIITTGEGGMVVTQDAILAERIRFLRDHAMDSKRRYWHHEIGYNYRLTNLQAAIGVAQLEKIDRFIKIRRQNAKLYRTLLQDLPGISLFPEAAWARPVYWMVSILVQKEAGKSRDELLNFLREQGIDSRPFFIPMHLLPPYKQQISCPNAENLSQCGLNLPSSTKLSPHDIEYIVSKIGEFLSTSSTRYKSL